MNQPRRSIVDAWKAVALATSTTQGHTVLRRLATDATARPALYPETSTEIDEVLVAAAELEGEGRLDSPIDYCFECGASRGAPCRPECPLLFPNEDPPAA